MSKGLCIIRFSSMGDVAMTVPIIKEFKKNYPDVPIFILTKKSFAPLYEEIDQVTVIGVDLKQYKGILGLIKLSTQLKKYPFDTIIDLHNVLRSQVISFVLKWTKGVKAYHLDKQRKERKALTRKENKVLQPLTPMTQKYAEVFRDAGYPFKLPNTVYKNNENSNRVGFAPYAFFEEKTLPLETCIQVAQSLADKGYEVCLMGGGSKEEQELQYWEDLHPNIINYAGKFTLKEELDLISTFRCMISMDSANMHLASMMGVRVISVWGATHPNAGFLGYGQSLEDVVQDSSLNCRPCSIFGNKPCRNDLDCLYNLNSHQIVEKVS